MNFSSISLALLTLLGAGSALAEAGRFQFVHGEVSVIHPNGSQSAARKGDLVDEGDTIATGALAQAQLVMKDEGLIALRPDTRLKIDTYRFSGKADGSEQGVFGLIKGGFRSITGWIGRANKDNYKVHTATATIGIRGTDHEALYIPPPVAGEAPLGPAGTYDKVNTGQTYLETGTGRVELSVNQVGFVPASGNTPPVRLPTLPSFLKATPSLQSGVKTQKSDADSAAAPAGTGENTPLVASSTATAPATALVLPLSLAAPNDTVTAAPKDTVTAAPNGTVIAGGGMGSNGPNSGAAYIGEPSGRLSLMLDAKGNPVSVSGDNFSYQRNGAAAVMLDAKTFGTETVRWGIYDGGTMVDNGITSSKPLFFWMTATSATTSANLLSALPTSSATLSLSTIGGFTEPITENGKRGSAFISSSITLKNLGGTPTVDSYKLQVTDSLARNWNASLVAPQSLDSFRSGSTQNLSGSCSGCGQASQASTSPISVSGNAQGVVIGNPTPVGMVSSYQMRAGTAAVAGSVLTTR